jgi:hypothetical protein
MGHAYRYVLKGPLMVATVKVGQIVRCVQSVNSTFLQLWKGPDPIFVPTVHERYLIRGIAWGSSQWKEEYRRGILLSSEDGTPLTNPVFPDPKSELYFPFYCFVEEWKRP